METINQECTNCGMDIDSFVRVQNAVENEGGAVPEFCCDDQQVFEQVQDEVEQVQNEVEHVQIEKEEESIKMETNEQTIPEVVPTEEVSTDVQLREENSVNNEKTPLQEALELAQYLQQQINEMRAAKSQPQGKKNQKPGRASATRKYVLLDKSLANWGRVPLQQQEIANLIARNMEVNKEYTEQEVFDLLIDKCGEYPSLCNSKQDPTYLFRYYRGLSSKDGKHAGFVARNFIRVIG